MMTLLEQLEVAVMIAIKSPTDANIRDVGALQTQTEVLDISDIMDDTFVVLSLTELYGK